MPYSVPESSPARGEHLPAEPQADTVARPAAEPAPPARPGSRWPKGGRRPSQVPVVQPKLRVGGDNDQHEREADLLARGLGGPTATPGGGADPHVTPAGGSAGRAVEPAIGQVIQDARGQGRPLPGNERGRYEHGLNTGLASVRLHTDQRADDLNRHFGSSALTAGQDIFFGHGEYDPRSAGGRDLLGHELVHTAQQAGGGTLVQLARKGQPSKKRMIKDESEEEAEGREEEEESGQEKPGKQEVKETPTPKKRRVTAAGKGKAAKGPDGDETSEIKVDYLDQGKMMDYLKSAEGGSLPVSDEDSRPRPVQVGVVVWNINHLKQDDEAAPETANEDDNVSVEEVLDEDSESDDEELDQEDQEDDAESMEFDTRGEYQADTIIDSLKDLRNELKKSSEGLLDFPIKTKKGGNREASQFKTDVGVLMEEHLDAVVKSGVAALVEFARQDGGESIAERAGRLKRIRELNRIWNRIARLNLSLFKGKTESVAGGVKKQKYDRLAIRAAMALTNSKTENADTIGQTLNSLLVLLPIRDIQRSVSKLKQQLVVELVTNRFFRKAPINLVLINEMNLGIDSLRQAPAPGIGLTEGPVMLAKGRRVDSGGLVIGKDKTAQRVKAKQYEYYPALHRATGSNALSAAGTFYVGTSGEFAPQYDSGANAGIPWDKKPREPDEPQVADKPAISPPAGNKGAKTDKELRLEERNRKKEEAERIKKAKEKGEEIEESEPARKQLSGKTFRGIVVHRYKQNEQEFWAGVLHTTPGGHDLERKDIWPQIVEPLTELNKLALTFKIPLLVGGDFYISSEGVVKNIVRGSDELREMREADPAGFGRAKAWSLARNVFLKAVEKKSIDSLLKKIEANNGGGPEEGSDREVSTGMELEESKTPMEDMEIERGQETPPAMGLAGMEIEESKPAPETAKVTESRGKGRGKRKNEDETPSAYQPGAGIFKAGNTAAIVKNWKKYREMVQGYFTEPEFSTKFNNKAALQRLTQGLEAEFADVTWQKSLAGGQISELTILRNYRRITQSPPRNVEEDEPKGPRATMELALQKLGYKVVVAANPTNPKEKGAGENKMQLADLFLVNQYWPATMGGIVAPETGRLQQVDTPGLDATSTFTDVSDHAPAALIASTVPGDRYVSDVFGLPPGAQDLVVSLNQIAWQLMEERLGGVKTTGTLPVGTQIDAIRAALRQPLISQDEVDQVRGQVYRLRTGIRSANNDHLSEARQKQLAEALEDLRQWVRPYSVANISNNLDE